MHDFFIIIMYLFELKVKMSELKKATLFFFVEKKKNRLENKNK